MRKAEYLWKELILEVKKLPVLISKSDYYNFLSNWIIHNQKSIGKEAIKTWGLIQLAELNPNDYALKQTLSDVPSMLNRLGQRLPDTNDTLAMFLNGDLESLIVFNVEQDCANNCTSVELEVWKNEENRLNQFVFICPLCGFAQLSNGQSYNGGKVKIAKKLDLKDANLIS